MSVRANLPGYRRLQFLRNSAIRTGVYTGVCLSLVFVVWLLIANQVPLLERFALERNIAAGGVLCFLAAVPVLRFLRMPGNLLTSSIIAWIIFSLVYGVLCLFFSKLGDKLSTSHLFMLGAVVYMILTTLCWIVSICRRAREADISHHQDHRAS
jgi:hypothetical protein